MLYEIGGYKSDRYKKNVVETTYFDNMLFRRIGLLFAIVFRHLYLSLASLSFCTTYFNFSTSLRLLRSH